MKRATINFRATRILLFSTMVRLRIAAPEIFCRAAMHRFNRHIASALFALLVTGCAVAPRAPAPAGTTPPPSAPAATTQVPRTETQAQLAREAAALQPLAQSDLGKRFLRAAESIPAVAARTAYRDDNTREFFSPAEAAALPEERRKKLASIELDEYRYYYTKYGSPLAYMRALDIAAANGVTDVKGERILDFGYGSIGHLRLLASLGAHTVGVDPDSYLDALYSQPGDQGAVVPARGVYRGAPGTVNLVHSRWPKDTAAISRVSGAGPYRLIVSKNTLKRGYLKPERRANRNQLIDLGVTDEVFLKAVFDALAPGGMLLIYNLAPKQAPNDKPYLPHADARSPFSAEQFTRAGFEVVTVNADDHDVVRQIGAALGWDKNDKGEMVNDLTTNLFALYTMVKRPK